MKNPDKPAMPFMFHENTEDQWSETGLTKREYFAAKAMQGLLLKDGWSERIISEQNQYLTKEIAFASVLLADELLKQLENE